MLIRWLNYLKERFPLPLYLLLSLGMAWQAQLAVQGRPETTGLIFASVMILGFFFCLRLMDEVKDFHKDQIAHPERPLARGLIKLDEAKRLILISMIIMLLLNISPPLLYSALARQFWSFTCLWLWLMYREFYCRRWLEKRVFLYAITHQVILFPLLSSVAMLGLSDWNQNILAP
ncbi:MAG: UbiA family prenyltransferase, partial [Proteobacteria bacterium]|nr:UbiA family prenyltransferase [Pseudomonadota bacterium]